jgi:phosphonate metabolism protein PhnN/1,5-bisphosphokinase (PRPP-forming)
MFIAVVGPSGAGKDSLINWAREALADDNHFCFPTRMITRPADASEHCASVTTDAFQSALNMGGFALHWQAHGLHYGLPAAIKAQLAEGRHVVANISRGTIDEARRRFYRTSIVLVRAHPDVLQARLHARGRESADDQANRLARNPVPDRSVEPDLVIENNDALEVAGLHFVRGLRQMTGTHDFALGL